MVSFKMPHFHFCLNLRVNDLSFFPQLTGKGKDRADRLPRVILAKRLCVAILCFTGTFTVFSPHAWYLLWLQSDAELSHPCIHLASSSKTSILHLMLLSMIVHAYCINTVWTGNHTSFQPRHLRAQFPFDGNGKRSLLRTPWDQIQFATLPLLQQVMCKPINLVHN